MLSRRSRLNDDVRDPFS